MTDLEIIRAMPKAEVHLHLEGTISPDTLWALARRNRVALPVSSLEELRALYAFEDFGKFIEVWMLMCSCLKAEEDYVGMVDGFLADCARQNVRYVEAYFTPYNHEKLGIGAARSLGVVTKRLAESEAAGGPAVRLILDLKARRIQHGVAAVEDAAVLRLLAERELCCDVALTSNAFLTPYTDLASHPIRRMIDAGVPVTISTDDPPFFGTDLNAEYRAAREKAGLSMEEIWQADLNGLRFGLADVALRRRLMLEFEDAGRKLGLA
jgi:adenosine deaminase